MSCWFLEQAQILAAWSDSVQQYNQHDKTILSVYLLYLTEPFAPPISSLDPYMHSTQLARVSVTTTERLRLAGNCVGMRSEGGSAPLF